MSATICRIRPLLRKVSYADEMSSGERFFQIISINLVSLGQYIFILNFLFNSIFLKYSGESDSNSSLQTSRAQSKPVPGFEQ
ncbi:unnamed protein product [Prunus brigantina]